MKHKIIAFLSAFLVLFLCFAPCFFAFASSPVVINLPFPNPVETFPDCGALVFYDNTYSRYVMLVYYPYSLNDSEKPFYSPVLFSVKNISSGGFSVTLNTKDYYIHYIPYCFTWNEDSYSYSLTKWADRLIVPNDSYSASLYEGVDVRNAVAYGNSVLGWNDSVSTTHTCSYSFNNQVTKSDIDYICGTIQNFSLQTDEHLTTLEFYCQEILNALGTDDFEEPSVTTTNEFVDELESAEENLNAGFSDFLNDYEPPDFGEQVDSISGNAFQFLKLGMEFFTGNKLQSYNTESNQTLDNPMRKISIIITIVLTLGIVSFALNIVSSKGSVDD